MKKSKPAFTLIEAIVVIFLASILILGIFEAFHSLFKVLELQSRKATATEIAQGEIEKIRNLNYLKIGTIGAQLPYASGILESSTSTILNNVVYKIERKIKYIFDPTDGEEECPLDYKRVEIKVSFSDKVEGEVLLTTDIAPKDKLEELQACALQPAGILRVQVFNTLGENVSTPKIEIFNPETGELVDFSTPSSGAYDFPLAPGNYKVVVSKDGYSTEKTYSITEVAIPEKPNPIVLQSQITQISFVIDKLSSLNVKTLSNYSQGFFNDSFENENKISEKSNVVILNGEVQLATDTQGYLPSGFLYSIEISPSDLIEWEEFAFSDLKPQGTDLRYQIYFLSDEGWVLIPDSDLPGNSVGFDQSPVNLKNLSNYSKIKIKANFISDSSATPVLYSWQVSWKNSQSIPISNVSFDLRGDKIIGKDENENPIYKFSKKETTNASGEILIPNLEWDVYHFSNFQKDSQALFLATSTPEHPVSLNPDTNLEVLLFLEAQNSLFLTVQDSETLNPIFSATATLSKTDFSQTQHTDINGQTIFIPLDSGSYTISVEALGYNSTSTTLYISGKTTKLIKLTPAE